MLTLNLMNYLAHAHLSFNNPAILVGNMISDFVKGKHQFSYSLPVQKGIQLHRAIDTFTDKHPATKEAIQYLKPAVGLYAGAFVDIIYDHFLALDKTEFTTSEVLLKSTKDCYSILEAQQQLPEKFKTMLPYMQEQNWLFNYQFLWGIEKSMQGLARRATYLDTSTLCYAAFIEHYEPLKQCYQSFFPSVKEYTLHILATT